MKNTFCNHTLRFIGAALLSLAIVSCKKKADPVFEPSANTITLDCNYFKTNSNAVLKHNPALAVDYIVTCKMEIDDDVTIEPGTVISFQENAGFEINENGSLASNGTAAEPVTLTGASKTKGYWAGIIFYSNDSKNKLSYTKVEYAGGDKFNSNDDRGAIVLYGQTQFKMDHCNITNSSTYGLNANYNDATMTLSNNTYSGNNVPMTVVSDLINMISGTDSYVGNTNNYVRLVNNISGINVPTVMRKLDVPYKMEYVSTVPYLEIFSDMSIEPGVIIEFSTSTGLYVKQTGSLYAVGTVQNPVIFRGAIKQAGYWANITYEFTNSVKNQLKNVKIQHAGGDPTETKGAIYMWAEPTLTLENVEFSDVLPCAVYAAPSGSNPNNNLTYNTLSYSNCGGQLCGD